MDWKQNYVSFYSKYLQVAVAINIFLLFRSDVDPDNPQHEQYAASVVGALITELESKAQALTNEEFFLTKIKLQGAAEMFRVSFLFVKKLQFHCKFTNYLLIS